MLVKCLLCFCLLSCLALPAQAQDNDPAARARELLGFTGNVPIPPPAPAYHPGDSDSFWVSKASMDGPTHITAELAAATPNVYLWVEHGLEYDPAAMQQLAEQLSMIWNVLQLRDNYGQLRVLPRSLTEFNVYARLAVPDVDNDAHLSVLYASDLRDLSNVAYNPNHSLMAELAPGGFSSQRELLIVNTSALPAVPLHDGAYAGLLTRQMVALLTYYNAPGQPDWLTNALGWFIIRQIQSADLTADDIRPFLDAPNTSLMQPSPAGGAGQEFGAQQLFLEYLRQRFSPQLLRDLFTQPGRGLQPLNAALAQNNVVDLVTGEPLTAADVFSDFALANVLNGAFAGDGRYLYRAVDFADAQPSVVVLRDNLNTTLNDGVVNQFGTRYIALTSATPLTVTISFAGQPTVNRLPMPGAAGNQFYWTDASSDAALTHPFDLRGVSEAALTFEAWHALADGWTYAYVQVSADGGATWDILPAATSSTANPYGVAYGVGFTGVSNTAPPRPFPYLGVGLAADGITVTEIVPDGPAAQAGLQVGDTIAGVEGQPWPPRVTLLGWLTTQAADDTVNLYVQRGADLLDVPLTLDAHPTRTFPPEARWLPQTVDLSAYAGQEILLRFQTISLPGRPGAGFAVDNLSIDAIGFRDDAEGGVPGWTLDGWRQMSNQTAQQFVVQAAHLSEAGSSVRRLLAPDDMVTSGSWPFTLAAGDLLLLAISGLNDDTEQPARFALAVRAEPTATPAR